MGTTYRAEPAASLFDERPTYQPSTLQHPPYSVIDAAGGWWQRRRAYWNELGHQDAGNRPASFHIGAPDASVASGNEAAVPTESQFSPVLTELLVAWYSRQRILDPFCGGPTRGFVAHIMGREYVGLDLNVGQVAANAAAYPELAGIWAAMDSAEWRGCALPFDCLLTCPPYHNIERYSDDPRDLSNMDYPAFLVAHERILRLAAESLLPGGFAVWVVGDFRAPDGSLRGFPDLVASQMDRAGLQRWNHHIVRQPLVTAPMRVRQGWRGLKATTTHSEVIVGRKPNGEQVA